MHDGANSRRSLDFYHRDLLPMINTQVAKGFAITGALYHALHCGPLPRRVLVITNLTPKGLRLRGGAGLGQPSHACMVGLP